MADSMEQLESMVSAYLANESMPTRERIRELITQLRATPIIVGVSDVDAELLARQLEARLGVRMDVGVALTGPRLEPWLSAARTDITPYYWTRYRRLLIDGGIPASVVGTVDSDTERVLGLMENPNRFGNWDRRGMVVGHVQSGKTANYIGLICKAADAGYQLIVVIAGVHNNLRNQTQLRIDEGFVGKDSARLLAKREDRFVGVGRFDNTRQPATFTNSIRDFNKAVANGPGIPLHNLVEPAVFVIKKNSNTLKNLIEWLKEHSLRAGSKTIDSPMLLIDDEADNASINTRYKSGEVTKINGQIRDLLKVFNRSCYVGYTATPFANIFVDPDTDSEMLGHDLFPRDFIYGLNPPSNYVGPTRVFLEESEDFIREIEDNEDLLPLKHPKGWVLEGLPPSLVDSLRAFVLARAIRLNRGHLRQHSSMLVNASWLLDVQRQLRNEIQARLELVQSSARVNGALPPDEALKDPEIRELHRVWKREYSEVSDWPEIQRRLHEAAAPISVVEVNGNSSGTLNYIDHRTDGLNVIAVGGFSLSRGLTLEGLVVSYFLRNSMMYDTLMQMGRWFGYRPDYDDLCRIWMPKQAEGWYAFITEATEELRDELKQMQAASATPQEFGLKVRNHPESLMITARNKMGSARSFVRKIGLAEQFLETWKLSRSDYHRALNRKAAFDLVQALSGFGHTLEQARPVPGGRLLSKAPVGPILDFLAAFRNHPHSSKTQPGPVRQYVESRMHSELAEWDIFVPSLISASPNYPAFTDFGVTINCQTRTFVETEDPDTLLLSANQKISSRGVEAIGLLDEDAQGARDQYRLEREHERTLPRDPSKLNYPDKIFRAIRPRPLLILHLIEILKDGVRVFDKPVVGWSISFPKTNLPQETVEYMGDSTFFREQGEDVDEEDQEVVDA